MRTAVLCLAMFASALTGAAEAGPPAAKELVLTNLHDAYVVPKGRLWKIEGLKPVEFEKGIGTADLYIDGEVLIGEDKSYTIYGKIEISANPGQSFPVWISAGAKVEVGDSRRTVVVKEYVVR
ncbi:hypothetical protein [Immundisolibacter sp.]|uniref:hypothetical protein n=1 Tax=Immundisolibacter sp. TaxID=1934948 RepID=UPI00356666C4